MRLIHEGDTYTSDDKDIELKQVPRYPLPPENVQGEPWGWTKRGRKPKGWRRDGRYDGS